MTTGNGGAASGLSLGSGRHGTTGIGSLPHHNVDAALGFSFQMGIPFLPQIPIRNPWEYMIAQALEGLPGLQVDREGGVSLQMGIWQSRTDALDARLAAAFERMETHERAFEEFEPSPSISSCWQPFLWEVSERKLPFAKAQLAGPMTAQWSLQLGQLGQLGQLSPSGPSMQEAPTALSTQIYRLGLARAIGMCRAIRRSGATPIFYLDEPGLYGFSIERPRHRLAFAELKLMIQTLRKEGAWIGIHCCSDTQWSALLELPIQFLSLDTALSLPHLLNFKSDLEAFVERGGRLSLGVIPTGRGSLLRSIEPQTLARELLASFRAVWPDRPDWIRRVLTESIYTPACGLALQSIPEAELILDVLTRFEATLDSIILA